MIKIIIHTFLISFIIFFSNFTYASHAAGMDITYKYLGSDSGITVTGREVTITVNTDFYGSEASWDIMDTNGIVYAQGGPYTNDCNNQTHIVTVCLPDNIVLNFNWYDSFGDGWNYPNTLCPGISNSQGSYSVIQGGNTLTSGSPTIGYGGSSSFTVNTSVGPICTIYINEAYYYEINLNFYFDCANGGITAPSSFDINYQQILGGYILTETLSLIGVPTSITPVCSSIIDPCSYGINYAYEKYTYTGIISLSSRGSWKVWNDPLCCRNMTTYTSNSTNDNLCVVANIDNTTYFSSSPVFSTDPLALLCAGGGMDCFYNGTTDPDFDNLSYSLTSPKTDEGFNDNISYQTGSTYLQPFPASTTTLDSMTGDLCVNTGSLGTSVTAIKVTESRNGVNLGYVTRDIQIWSMPCSGISSTSSVISSPNTTFNSINNSFSFYPDGSSQLSFDIQAASTVIIEMLNSTLPTGATFTSNTTTPFSSNTVVGTFSWTPTAADTIGSPYVINLITSDDNCPIPNSNSETYLIYLT